MKRSLTVRRVPVHLRAREDAAPAAATERIPLEERRHRPVHRPDRVAGDKPPGAPGGCENRARDLTGTVGAPRRITGPAPRAEPAPLPHPSTRRKIAVVGPVRNRCQTVQMRAAMRHTMAGRSPSEQVDPPQIADDEVLVEVRAGTRPAACCTCGKAPQRCGSCSVFRAWNPVLRTRCRRTCGQVGSAVSGFAVGDEGVRHRARVLRRTRRRPLQVIAPLPTWDSTRGGSATVLDSQACRRCAGAEGSLGNGFAVLGASGECGHHVVQIAHAAGARVTAVILQPAKARSRRELGADEVLDYAIDTAGCLPTCVRHRRQPAGQVATNVSPSVASLVIGVRRWGRSPGDRPADRTVLGRTLVGQRMGMLVSRSPARIAGPDGHGRGGIGAPGDRRPLSLEQAGAGAQRRITGRLRGKAVIEVE